MMCVSTTQFSYKHYFKCQTMQITITQNPISSKIKLFIQHYLLLYRQFSESYKQFCSASLTLPLATLNVRYQIREQCGFQRGQDAPD